MQGHALVDVPATPSESHHIASADKALSGADRSKPSLSRDANSRRSTWIQIVGYRGRRPTLILAQPRRQDDALVSLAARIKVKTLEAYLAHSSIQRPREEHRR